MLTKIGATGPDSWPYGFRNDPGVHVHGPLRTLGARGYQKRAYSPGRGQ